MRRFQKKGILDGLGQGMTSRLITKKKKKLDRLFALQIEEQNTGSLLYVFHSFGIVY